MYYKSKQLALTLLKLIEENPAREEKIIDNFINFCQAKNITQQLPNMVKKMEELARQKAAGDDFIIRVKDELSPENLSKIKELVGAKKVEPKQIIDGETQGGFVAKYRGKVYDGSVRGQIEKLKGELK